MENIVLDCAIKANARYIVSNDRHFKELRNISFPRVEVINILRFIEALKKL